MCVWGWGGGEDRTQRGKIGVKIKVFCSLLKRLKNIMNICRRTGVKN